MERPVRQAYLGMISKQVAPVLRGHGFKRSGGTFRRISAAGHAAVIEFQGSRAGGSVETTVAGLRHPTVSGGRDSGQPRAITRSPSAVG